MTIDTRRQIQYGRQSISDDDIDAVVSVLRSDWLTQGPAIEAFEQDVADYCETHHAIAVSSATAALHIACQATGLGPGDSLWTSPNTFVASANCARYCGADVDFVDIDQNTGNMSVPALSQRLETAKRLGKLPKALIPVHFAGQSCDMEAIKKLADEYGFSIIEDASHAIGGRYKDMPIGGCHFSNMAVFSFHPVKIVTTGEGGMILTNNNTLAEKLRQLRTHGITRDPKLMRSKPKGRWEYEQVDLGFNYRITDIQAALGRSQFQRIDKFVERRHALANVYLDAFKNVPQVQPLKCTEDAYSAYHIFVVRLSSDTNRLEVFNRLRNNGIEVNVHYIPVHLQPYYQDLGFRKGDFPEAEAYYSSALTLPLYYDLSTDDQQFVIHSLISAVQAKS